MERSALDTSFQHALLFLGLAVEQLHIYSPAAADAVQSEHLAPLSTTFEWFLQRIDQTYIQTLDLESRRRAHDLAIAHQAVIEQAMGDYRGGLPGFSQGFVQEDIYRGPPGSSQGLVHEAMPREPPGLSQRFTQEPMLRVPPGLSEGFVHAATPHGPPGISQGFAHEAMSRESFSFSQGRVQEAVPRGLQLIEMRFPLDTNITGLGVPGSHQHAHTTPNYLPRGPPGFGQELGQELVQELVQEAIDKTNRVFPTLQLAQGRPNYLPTTELQGSPVRGKPVSDYGAIGQGKAPSARKHVTSQRLTQWLSSTSEQPGSLPLNGTPNPSAVNTVGLSRKSPENPFARSPKRPTREASIDLLGNASVADKFTQSPLPSQHETSKRAGETASADTSQNPEQSYENSTTEKAARASGGLTLPTAPNAVPLSWAKIAAMKPKAEAKDTGSGRLNSVVKGVGKTSQTPLSKPQSGPAQTEAIEEQYRAIWIINLPSSYTIRNISSQITEGPLMSIMVGNDLAEGLQGHSACVIFQHAKHALAFLTTHNNDVAVLPGHDAAIPTTRFVPAAPTASMVLAAPYPSDADIESMDPPRSVRRRVQFVRARLFHDLPMSVFKKDMLDVAGGAANIEFFHFYNPGECFVVFSSVAVAVACSERFRAWSGGHVVGAGRFSERYKGVQVRYAHDFNEQRGVLWTVYGKGGQLLTGVAKFDKGREGSYGGPVVGGV